MLRLGCSLLCNSGRMGSRDRVAAPTRAAMAEVLRMISRPSAGKLGCWQCSFQTSAWHIKAL